DRQLRTLLARAPQAALIAVHDARGVNRGWAGPEGLARRAPSRANIFDRPDFRQVMALNLPQISDVLPPERLGEPGLVATVPIRDDQDRPVGGVGVGAL